MPRFRLEQNPLLLACFPASTLLFIMVQSFLFIATRPELYNEWILAIDQHLSKESLALPDDHKSSNDAPTIQVTQGRLQDLDSESLRCDCIVSPANSFGIMDGGQVCVSSHLVLFDHHDQLRSGAVQEAQNY